MSINSRPGSLPLEYIISYAVGGRKDTREDHRAFKKLMELKSGFDILASTP